MQYTRKALIEKLKFSVQVVAVVFGGFISFWLCASLAMWSPFANRIDEVNFLIFIFMLIKGLACAVLFFFSVVLMGENITD